MNLKERLLAAIERIKTRRIEADFVGDEHQFSLGVIDGLQRAIREIELENALRKDIALLEPSEELK